ncbi:mitochondrial carrier domain-containing protein [Protomyces lactucae-debilis]|uniref:Mitochondrial carrier domain-containing protein n=1 Tax=Protomyces lactucae-debilis TaxID=2754530 RepID=A0A1Y2FF66_PROLT|nr:mitochondrial carrier domain-containing protein [Protomyces lactucae-debilis]ORY82588.1 mitochondrial carrier domain-containing protein [Protomyces lactucae-debilis]
MTTTSLAPVCETDAPPVSPRLIQRQSLDYVVRTGIAGGLAGCAAKTLIAPLDRVKILFQTSNPDYIRHASRWNGLALAVRDIHKTSGLRGLFKGHAATLLRIFPYAGIKFIAYEQFRSLLIRSEREEVVWRRFTAGALAGLTSVFFTYPLEVIRVRLAFDTRHPHGGIVSVCREIYKTSLADFYRGFTPTMVGMLPYAGVSFLTHDAISDLLRTWSSARKKSQGTEYGRAPLAAWAELVSGGLAGMLSQTASYPFEVIRRRMQVSGAVGSGQSIGFWQTARLILKTAGPGGFYVGLTIGFIKTVPMVACSFYVYERLKVQLHVN